MKVLLYVCWALLLYTLHVYSMSPPFHLASSPSYSARGLRELEEYETECHMKESMDTSLVSHGYVSDVTDGRYTRNILFGSKNKANVKNDANNKKETGRRNSKDAQKGKDSSKWGRSRLLEGMVFLAQSMPYVVNKTHMTSVANFLYTSGGEVTDKVSRRMNTELTKVYRISNACGKWLGSLNNDILSNVYRYDAACQTYEITKQIDAQFMGGGDVSPFSVNSNNDTSYIDRVKTAHQLAQLQRNLYRSLVFRLRNIYSTSGPLARFDPGILDAPSHTNSTWSSYKEEEFSARAQSMASERSDFILNRFPSKVFLTGPQGGIGQHLLKEVYYLMAAKQDEEKQRRRREYYWNAYGADMRISSEESDSEKTYTATMPNEDKTVKEHESDHNTERPVLVLATRPHKLPQLISNVAEFFRFRRDVRLIGIPLDLGCYQDMSVNRHNTRDHQTKESANQGRLENVGEDVLETKNERKETHHYHHDTLFPGQSVDFDMMIQNAFDATPDSLDWLIQNAGILPLDDRYKERNTHNAQKVALMRTRNRRRIKKVLYDTPRALYLRCESLMNAQLNSTRVAALQKEEEIEGVLRATIIAHMPVPVLDAIRHMKAGVGKCRKDTLLLVGAKVKCFSVKMSQYFPQQSTDNNEGKKDRNSKGSSSVLQAGKGKSKITLFPGEFFNDPFSVPFSKKNITINAQTRDKDGKHTKTNRNNNKTRKRSEVESLSSFMTSPIYTYSKNTTSRVGAFILNCSSNAVQSFGQNAVVCEASYLLREVTGKIDASLQLLTNKIRLAVPVQKVGESIERLGQGANQIKEGMLYMLPMRGQRNESNITKALSRDNDKSYNTLKDKNRIATSWKENLDEMKSLSRALLEARSQHVKHYLGFDLNIDDTGDNMSNKEKEKETDRRETPGQHLPFHLFHDEAHGDEVEESMFLGQERARNDMDAVDRVRDVYSINALGPFALSLLMIPKLMLSDLSNPCLVFVSSSSHLRVPYLDKWNIPDAFTREALLDRCKIDGGNTKEEEKSNNNQKVKRLLPFSSFSQKEKDQKKDVLHNKGFNSKWNTNHASPSRDHNSVYPPTQTPAGDILPNPVPPTSEDNHKGRESASEDLQGDTFFSHPPVVPSLPTPHQPRQQQPQKEKGEGGSRAHWERNSNLLISSRHPVAFNSMTDSEYTPLETIGYRSNLKKYVKRVIFGEEYIPPKPRPWYAPLSDLIDKYLPQNMFTNSPPNIQSLDWREVEKEKGLSRNKMFNRSRQRYFKKLKREEEENKRASRSRWWWPGKANRNRKEEKDDHSHSADNETGHIGSSDDSIHSVPSEQFVHCPNHGFARVLQGDDRHADAASTDSSKSSAHKTRDANDGSGSTGSADSPIMFNPAILTEGSKAYLEKGRIWSSAQANTVIETQKNITSVLKRLFMLDRTPKVYNLNKLPSMMDTYAISKLHLVMAANALSTRFDINSVDDIEMNHSRGLEGTYDYKQQNDNNCKEKKELSPGSLWVRSTHPGLVDTPMLQSFFSNMNFPLRKRVFRSPNEGAASVLLSMLYPYPHLDKAKYRNPTGTTTTMTSKTLLGLGSIITRVGSTWQGMLNIQDQVVGKIRGLSILFKLSKDNASKDRVEYGNNLSIDCGGDFKEKAINNQDSNRIESKLNKSRNYFVDGKPGGQLRVSPSVKNTDNNDFIYAQMVVMLSPVLRKRIRDEALIASKILKHYSKTLPPDTSADSITGNSGYDIRVREGQGLTKEIALKRAILLQKFADEIIRIE